MSYSEARLNSGPSQQRPDGRYTDPLDQDLTCSAESWVELSSQPSSSSLSSIDDEIVTTGLRVGGQHPRRRCVPPSVRPQQTVISRPNTSSQDEYSETDSEDDRLLASSAENILHHGPSDAESDDGDNATALGTGRPVFRPQPNAFSHPPSHNRSNSASASMPPHPHGSFTRPSFSQRSQTRVRRGAPNFMSPSSHEDNDAALRASLTTLLSCAAAARGLPKSKSEAESQTRSSGISPSNQPIDLRLVSESDLDQDPKEQLQAAPSPSPNRTTTLKSCAEKSKRSASASRSPRATRRKRAAVESGETLISPTLLTWVVSAGVIVLVSVVGFGAGYVIGKEVGRQEALAAGASSMNETTSCGREVIRSSSGGLRRLKWGAVGRSIVA